MYTSTPGTIAMATKSTSRRSVRREPNTFARSAPQAPELVADQRDERHRDHAVQDQQQGIVLRKERRVGARHREQEEQDPAERRADDERVGHRCASACSTGPFTVHLRHCPPSVQSRLASALTWNGFGSWAVSRRMRTYAT